MVSFCVHRLCDCLCVRFHHSWWGLDAMTDPTFTTRRELEAWAVAHVRVSIQAFGMTQVMHDIVRVTLAHAHLLTLSKGTPS